MNLVEKLLASALRRPGFLTEMVEGELERLVRGGYLPREEVERLKREGLLAALEAPVEQATAGFGSAISGVGQALRDLLDVPSRAELEALREELRRAEGRAAGSTGTPETP